MLSKTTSRARSSPGWGSPGVPAQAAPPPARPRLVVVVSVDGLSFDRLESYRSWYTAGLKRLLDEGRVETACRYRHLNTETGPGHSSLSTGAPPRVTGIVANRWFERLPDGGLRVINSVDQAAPSGVPGVPPLFYREVARDGRLYVFARAADLARWEQSGEIGRGTSRLGCGTRGRDGRLRQRRRHPPLQLPPRPARGDVLPAGDDPGSRQPARADARRPAGGDAARRARRLALREGPLGDLPGRPRPAPRGLLVRPGDGTLHDLGRLRPAARRARRRRRLQPHGRPGAAGAVRPRLEEAAAARPDAVARAGADRACSRTSSCRRTASAGTIRSR